jgi:hypothetical protein
MHQRVEYRPRIRWGGRKGSRFKEDGWQGRIFNYSITVTVVETLTQYQTHAKKISSVILSYLIVFLIISYVILPYLI